MIFVGLSPSTPPPSNSKFLQNWKYVHKFRHWRLGYHLVIRCRRNFCQNHQWLDGTNIPFPCYITYWITRRRNPKYKARHRHWRLIKPESNFQLSRDSHFRFYEPIPPPKLDNFCGSRYVTRLPKFVSKFQDKNGTELNVKLKYFLDKTQHTTNSNCIMTCIARANVLYGRLGSIKYQYLCTTVIILDTCA